MSTYFIFLLVVLMNSSGYFTAKVNKCEDSITETTNGVAYWKYRGIRYAISEDFLCRKHDGELLLRECNITTGQWHPENVECKAQDKVNTYCPEDLLEIRVNNNKWLCLKISNMPQKYDKHFCYGSDVITPQDLSKHETLHFIQLLQNRNITKYWLPYYRENTSDPFTISLPGKQWNEVINNVKILDFKNCMSVWDAQKQISKQMITDCNELIYSICVFRDNIVTSSGCTEGLGALSYRPNECYGVNWNTILPKAVNKVRTIEYFMKRMTLQRVLKHSVPDDKKKKIFQIDNFVGNMNDEYAILMDQNEMFKIMKRDLIHYPVLYKETMKIQDNLIQLILKIESNELILVIYNQKYLWRVNEKDIGVKCFTNADYEILRSTKIHLIWESQITSKSIYKLKLVGDGPGEYWCEGHTISDFRLVSSHRIVAAKEIQGHVFAIKINSPCIIININKYFNICENIYKNFKLLAKHLNRTLRNISITVNSNIFIHNTRIMSIDNISEDHINCWIHLTASLRNSEIDRNIQKSSAEDNSIENNEIYGVLERNQMLEILKKVISIQNPNTSNIIRSTEYCFTQNVYLNNNEVYQLNEVIRGQIGTLSRPCLQNNGMPYAFQCNGNFIQGAYWESRNNKVSCHLEDQDIQLTNSLYSLESSEMLNVRPGKIVEQLKNILSSHAYAFLPVDIYYAANIMQIYSKSLERSLLDFHNNVMFPNRSQNMIEFSDATRNLIAIYNYLIDVNDSTIQLAAQLNSTNKMLEVFEIAMNWLLMETFLDENFNSNMVDYRYDDNEMQSSSDFEVFDYIDIGVSVKVSSNLLYFIIDPSIANISGIALFQNNNNEQQNELKGAFKNEHYRFLQSNHEIEDFIYDPFLQLGTYIPSKLLYNLGNISTAFNKTFVVIKIYSNDKIFQVRKNQERKRAISRVVSISLPGRSSHLPEDLPIAFRLSKSIYSNKTAEFCNYWNFENWASDGIQVLDLQGTRNDVVICQVNHLTPFAFLVGYNLSIDDVKIRQVHKQALDIITVTGCTLSLLGISGIFITAAIFNSWRKKPSSNILLQLSAAISIQMVVFCFINMENYSLHLIINTLVSSCVAIGAFLYYSVLVQFFWMLVIAYLQFTRYVQVFGRTRPKRFVLKSTVFCWGIPIIPLLLVVILDHDSFSKGTICYPTGKSLYFGIIVPILIIITANFIFFCLIIYNIVSVSSVTPIRHTKQNLWIHQIRLSILLFFMLGFTWIFGVLTLIKAGIIFSYLFCLTATLQGFIIFVYFIIVDPSTSRMWFAFFEKLCRINKNYFHSNDNDTAQTNY